MSKEIKTNCGKLLKLDDEDYERVKDLSINWCGGTPQIRFTKTSTSLSNFLLGSKQGFIIDHIDRDQTNFLRSNLRYATRQQNSFNQKSKNTNKSGYKGVSWNIRRKKWQASICVNYKQVYLGIFSSPKEAALVYNEAAKKYHGEFANLNQI